MIPPPAQPRLHRYRQILPVPILLNAIITSSCKPLSASAWLAGKDAHWQKISGLGYQGEAVTVFPTTVATRSTPDKITAESPCLRFKFAVQDAGDWRAIVRALPTFSVEADQPQRYAIALDDAAPKIVSLPVSLSETDRQWSENVLRNAAPTTSTGLVHLPARRSHALKIFGWWTPGIVLDAVALRNGENITLGYVWPAETRVYILVHRTASPKLSSAKTRCSGTMDHETRTASRSPA